MTPSPAVLRAFGADGPAVRLPGGQGATWRAGGIVVRPGEPAETAWRADLYTRLLVPDGDGGLVAANGGFRVPEPIPASDTWCVDGWEAWRLLPGAADPSRPADVVAVGLAFAAALAGEPAPSLLDERDDPWAVADRVAFGEAPSPDSDVVAALLDVVVPVREPSTLIHGDLLGNVLFDPGSVPTVIDWPAYRRPAAFGSAVAVVDALCWHGAPFDLLDAPIAPTEWTSMCARALVFRTVTDLIVRPGAPLHDAYAPVIAAVLDRSRP